jgi:hypothetical protein
MSSSQACIENSQVDLEIVKSFTALYVAYKEEEFIALTKIALYIRSKYKKYSEYAVIEKSLKRQTSEIIYSKKNGDETATLKDLQLFRISCDKKASVSAEVLKAKQRVQKYVNRFWNCISAIAYSTVSIFNRSF